MYIFSLFLQSISDAKLIMSSITLQRIWIGSFHLNLYKIQNSSVSNGVVENAYTRYMHEDELDRSNLMFMAKKRGKRWHTRKKGTKVVIVQKTMTDEKQNDTRANKNDSIKLTERRLVDIKPSIVRTSKNIAVSMIYTNSR